MDYASLADAVHEVICSSTKDDGYKWCLSYALLGCAWLKKYTHLPHVIVGGKFVIDKVNFEHFWIMQGTEIYIDLATRHNARIIREGIAVDQWKDSYNELNRPYYVGDGQDIPWKYVVQREPTQFALEQYRLCVHPVHLVDKLYKGTYGR